jgi:hypothetical protein
MKVEMIRDRNYRGSHAGRGLVLDMDDATAREFVAKGYSKPYAEPAPMTAAEAEAVLPTKQVRRNARR